MNAQEKGGNYGCGIHYLVKFKYGCLLIFDLSL